MSLFGALFTGVSALTAQSQSMGMISDNIANVSTIGYKRSEAAFSSLVTAQTRSTAYSSGGVRASTLQRIDQQGTLQQSSSATDIAISGNGFFVVKNNITSALQEPFYTRAGQFSEDASGYLVNPSGQYLMGWPVDQEGNIPSGSGDISSLSPVDVAFLGGITRPTTKAAMNINLNMKETPNVYPLSSPVSIPADFSRALRVYDSLGEGQDVTVKFYRTTSPTATASGTVKIEGVTNLMDSYSAVASTATLTSGVTITPPATLASVAPGLVSGDTFTIKLNGVSANISLNPTWTITDLANAVNTAFNPATPASVVADQLVLTANTPIEIKSGGSQPVSEANLQAVGLNFGITKRAPVTFTVQSGGGPVQTVTINDGDSASDLVSHINNLPNINAQLDANGKLVIASDDFGQPLTIAGAGGAGQITVAGLAAIGLSQGVSAPPAAPNTLTTLDGAANPQNWWQVEMVAPDGTVLTSGMINFNGDGSINSVDQPATINLSAINWGNGSNPQDIAFDISNFTQYSGSYNVVSTDQNGAELGLRTGVSIDAQGYVIARFSNGESAKLYKLPIATFANANGLIGKNGSAYQESNESGSYNLREAGEGGAGTLEGGTLETSNVDIADEFSKMIVTQRAYSAGTKIINTSDQMLQELLQLR